MAIMRLRAVGAWSGGDIFNFGLHVDSTASLQATATAWAAALTDMWSGTGTPAGTLSGYYTDQMTINTASAVSLVTATGQQIERIDVPLTLAGTATGEQMPPQVALVVSLRTILATKRGRGRFYLPAMATNVLAAGRLSPAAQTGVLNAAARGLNSLVAAGAPPVIWSIGLPTPPTVSRIEVGDVFDTQRRRRDQLTEARVAATIS